MYTGEKEKEFKDRLVELMQYYNIRQVDVSEVTGISKSMLSMYISGKRTPHKDKLRILSEKYHVSIAWLEGYHVPMFSSESYLTEQGVDSLDELAHGDLDDLSKQIIDGIKDLSPKQKKILIDMIGAMKEEQEKYREMRLQLMRTIEG